MRASRAVSRPISAMSVKDSDPPSTFLQTAGATGLSHPATSVDLQPVASSIDCLHGQGIDINLGVADIAWSNAGSAEGMETRPSHDARVAPMARPGSISSVSRAFL